VLQRSLIALALCAGALAPARADAPPAPVGSKVADFTLPDPRAGKDWALAQHARGAKATVIVFAGSGCPVCTAYWPRLIEMHKRYSEEGVAFVAVNSGALDSADEVAAAAKELKLPFPYLKDDGTKLADRLSVERVPTVVVLDGDRGVRYAGRVDDQFAVGVHKPKPTSRELGSALDSILERRAVKTPHAPASGCKLSREKKPKADSAVTFHKHVAPVLQAKCADCHRKGEAGPFPLLTYAHAKGRADMIREVVAEGIMPPWHADAPRGHFANDRRLSDAEKRTLLEWVDAGCPEGDPKDAPRAPERLDGWRLPKKPDLVLTMKDPVAVPASTALGLGMDYRYVEVGDPFKEDTWVQAVEVRPGYRAVVHHIIVFMLLPNEPLNDDTFARHMLGTYVPGDQPVVFPEGTARKVPRGAKLLFELHYTPNGTPGADRSQIGLVLAKGPPQIESKTDCASNRALKIPPGAANHTVTASFAFERAATLTAFTPHMHLRGKAFKYELVKPDGTREVLLNVPKYDFNWQASYLLAKPLAVPAGSKIECTAWYDNSAANPFNPNPKKTVEWGNQTWEEMMIGFFEYHDTK
jgi:peroxiredoxin